MNILNNVCLTNYHHILYMARLIKFDLWESFFFFLKKERSKFSENGQKKDFAF